MIHILGKIPMKVVIAFSGGVDSVAVTNFLIMGGRDITLAFFHHGTPTSDKAEQFVRKFAKQNELRLETATLSRPKDKDESQEEFWRRERYSFLESFKTPVITCHHLDDAVETWIFTSLHGLSKLIPYRRGNVLRPFLTTPKREFIDWCNWRGLEWVEDESNNDLKYARNRIRHNIVPEALKINPGISGMISRMYKLNGKSVTTLLEDE